MSKNIIFQSAKEFISALVDEDKDLYNPLLNKYLFHYSEAGAVAQYFITPRNARNLARESALSGEYWGAFLGFGGSIYEGADLEYLAEELYKEKGWMLCSDVKF